MGNWFTLFKRKGPYAAPSLSEGCSSPSLKHQIATYPVDLTDRLSGRHVDVYRVELDRCRQCGHLMPTAEGRAKIKRCIKAGRTIVLKGLD